MELGEKLQKKCQYNHEKQLKSSSEGRVTLRYREKVVESGTRADKVALALLLLKESPFAYWDQLDFLYQEFTRSKRAVSDNIGAVVDAFDALVPHDRLLVPLETR